VILSELDAQTEPGMETLRHSRSPRAALKDIRRQAPIDMLAATQLAMTADWARVYLLSRLDPQVVEDLFMVPVSNGREIERLLPTSDSCVFLSGAQHTWGEVGTG
jgi:hypothetical protein